MWVTPDDLCILAAENAIGECNFVKLEVLTDTLLSYSHLKNQPDSIQNNRDQRAKYAPLKNERARNSGHFVVRALASKEQQRKRCLQNV